VKAPDLEEGEMLSDEAFIKDLEYESRDGDSDDEMNDDDNDDDDASRVDDVVSLSEEKDSGVDNMVDVEDDDSTPFSRRRKQTKISKDDQKDIYITNLTFSHHAQYGMRQRNISLVQ
jgi:hypothetical protein